jgi:Arc/MetJ family transcription regulator
MRTSKVLDDGLAGETVRCTDVKTKQELVDPGLSHLCHPQPHLPFASMP